VYFDIFINYGHWWFDMWSSEFFLWNPLGSNWILSIFKEYLKEGGQGSSNSTKKAVDFVVIVSQYSLMFRLYLGPHNCNHLPICDYCLW